MKLGRVIGTVVCTTKADGMEGLKLLLVRPLDSQLRPEGVPFVATDASGPEGYGQAGPGTLVTYESSREAALLHHPRFVPVDKAIVGIVDQYATEDPA
ncbi:MAG: EutN/CcmL family microcompartment protein [Myxococcales bacterium]|nr:EutN/CcmL family microcompartment protein [Myxococcales bacterium]